MRRIALVAPPWYPLPPVGYGGTELVVTLLARGLRDLGHEVIVYGAEGSEDGVTALAPESWSDDLGTWKQGIREAAWTVRIMRDLERRGPVDIIHDHVGAASMVAALFRESAPMVHTVHGPLRQPWITLYEDIGDDIPLIGISHHQRKTAPHLGWLGVVHNAVDVDALHRPGEVERQDYLLTLSRICPDKGQHIAIEVARRAGKKLILAGKIGVADGGREYFEKDIAPHIDGRNVVYIPNVAGREKAKLIAQARAMLVPIQWPEPFGLVMAEGLASGTPVIAMKKGAASEIVHDGATGFLVEDADEMTDRLAEIDQIDPMHCARIARDCFSPRAMAEGYLRLYDQILGETPVVNLSGYGRYGEELVVASGASAS